MNLPEHTCTLVKKQWLGDSIKIVETGDCDVCAEFFWGQLARSKDDDVGLDKFLDERTQQVLAEMKVDSIMKEDE